MTVRVVPTLRPIRTWLSDVVGGSGHGTRFRRGVELELRVHDAVAGLGEASPLPNFSLEHLEDAELELAKLKIIETDLPNAPSEARDWLVAVVRSAELTTASARFAFEAALLDLGARHLDLSVASLVGQITGQGTPAAALPLSKLLFGSDPQSLLNQARRACARGYRTLKVKLALIEDFDAEVATLERLREELAPTIRLRLDPNQGWPLELLPKRLARLQPILPELIEEPASCSDLCRCEGSPIPLALDESLRDQGRLENMAPHLKRVNIRAIVIKPALHGLLHSLDLAKQARDLGLEVIFTHLFDGPVGHATAASLALSLGSEIYAHGLAPHPGLLLAPTRRIIGLGAGQLQHWAGPGHPLADVPQP